MLDYLIRIWEKDVYNLERVEEKKRKLFYSFFLVLILFDWEIVIVLGLDGIKLI